MLRLQHIEANFSSIKKKKISSQTHAMRTK